MAIYLGIGGTTQDGWAVIIKMDSGIAFEYQHMQSECILVEGSRVLNGQFIGVEGTTGQITGLHLHMEMQDLSSGRDWDYNANLSSYMNPADFMRYRKCNRYKLDL